MGLVLSTNDELPIVFARSPLLGSRAPVKSSHAFHLIVGTLNLNRLREHAQLNLRRIIVLYFDRKTNVVVFTQVQYVTLRSEECRCAELR